MIEIVFASKNANKVIEVQEKMASCLDVKLLSLEAFEPVPDVIEDRPDIEGNSQKKAEEMASRLQKWVLADDSGLVVDALDGAPGVYSARYSGENATYAKNNQKLLKELANVPEEKRTARFICVLTLANPKGKVFSVCGTLEGKIATDLQGEHGFGYDPLFILPEKKIRLAELSLEEKNKISHRAQALEKFVQKWKDFSANNLTE